MIVDTAKVEAIAYAYKEKCKADLAAEYASKRAWEYLAGRLKALLPVLALGIILGVIAMALFNHATLGTALLSVLNGLWEFLGLYSAGFPAAFSQANGAMWFISGLLICSYFLYFLLCKNEDKTEHHKSALPKQLLVLLVEHHILLIPYLMTLPLYNP